MEITVVTGLFAKGDMEVDAGQVCVQGLAFSIFHFSLSILHLL
jgi:hypothetical protein